MSEATEMETDPEFFSDEAEKSGRCGLGFVSGKTLATQNWWNPPKLSGDGVYSAEWDLGQLFGLQFAAYLKHNARIRMEATYDLGEIVEAMTGVKLDNIQKGFFLTLSREIGGQPNRLVIIGDFTACGTLVEERDGQEES